MGSKSQTKKSTIDVALMIFYEYIADYDIPLREQSERSIKVIEFWDKNRRKYFKLQKRAHTAKRRAYKHNVNFAYIVLQIKAICDGKEPTLEVVGHYTLSDLDEFVKKCVTAMNNKRKTLYK